MGAIPAADATLPIADDSRMTLSTTIAATVWWIAIRFAPKIAPELRRLK